MCVCVCVCVCVYVCVCVCVSVSVSVSVCLCMCMYVYAFVYVHVYVYAYAYAYVNVYSYKCFCMCARACVCLCVHNFHKSLCWLHLTVFAMPAIALPAAGESTAAVEVLLHMQEGVSNLLDGCNEEGRKADRGGHNPLQGISRMVSVDKDAILSLADRFEAQSEIVRLPHLQVRFLDVQGQLRFCLGRSHVCLHAALQACPLTDSSPIVQNLQSALTPRPLSCLSGR